MKKKRIFEIIQIGNREDTVSKVFDIFIVLVIISNIATMFLDTFTELEKYSNIFYIIEIVTIFIFCIEYILRIWTAEYLYPELSRPKAIFKFLLSFDGVIDLLTILPFFFLSGFVVFRMLRVVRIFNLFRINAKYDSFNVITTVLSDKKDQILSSIFIILILMFASSLCMYGVEHEIQPEQFRNAFSGIWWAVSTVLTVGYGDIYPVTTIGKLMAIIIGFLGVGVVAIPTGIISAGFVEQYTKIKNINSYSEEADIKFITITIDEKGSWRDKSIKKLNLPKGLILALIIRNKEVIVPSGDTILLLNDKVILCAEAFQDKLNIRLKEIAIKEKHPWVGKAIKNLNISRQTIIIMIKRKNKSLVPHGSTIIKEGDIIFLYSKQNIKDATDVFI